METSSGLGFNPITVNDELACLILLDLDSGVLLAPILVSPAMSTSTSLLSVAEIAVTACPGLLLDILKDAVRRITGRRTLPDAAHSCRHLIKGVTKCGERF